jgi:hypothetical protein
MTTAHLYETEDVTATLLYSLRTVNTRTAVQAYKELEVSSDGDNSYILQVLLLAWFLSPPGHAMEAMCAHAVLQNDPKGLLCALLQVPAHDYGEFDEPVIIPPPKPSLSPQQPMLWTCFPQEYTTEQAVTFYRAVKYALKHKFWQHAAYLTHSFIPHNIQSAIQLLEVLGVPSALAELLDTAVYAPLQSRILSHLLAAHVQAPSQTAPVPIQLNICPPPGRRGRVLRILPEALGEWNLKQKSAERLRGLPRQITAYDACTYWKHAVEKYGIIFKDETFIFKDPAQSEQFYGTYFPDDIPDEWSDEERAKSHPPIATVKPTPWAPALRTL